ncbi:MULTISPECIES: phage tail family protein [Bacillus]|uniref:Phage tail family protein n=1 Tax=Bacillus mojavensis TaxID=72360 RepID=A0AAP3CR62_BACMO|nr:MULTISPECIES: phage tail family protein [Bacillus subtilis group]KAF1681278.1 phage tail protein [Bacillus sp. SKDU12]AUS10892.1 phage tail family protein [Bacillus subtilis]MBR0009779.1 phage tail family protein [Bacillus subtilis]MCY8509730.1 phage tail family protein [Bacillus mojavensis]MCY8985634.1 phage tail family protein [Bacillus subtilis]
MVKLFIDFNNGLGEQSLDSLLPQFEVLSFLPEAPNINRETITIPRRHGLILPQHPRDVTYGERKINVEFYLNALKHENFYMYRHQLYALLVKPFPYYISSDLWPNRRFLVTCDGNFSIQKEKEKTYNDFSVEFTNITGMAESTFTTKDKQYFTRAKRTFGMNIPPNDQLNYSFKNQKRFSVFNPGDVQINPLDHDYNVLLNAAGKNVTLINHTNDEKLTIEQELKKSQQVSFLKQYTIINNTPIKTSGRLPSLEIGWNEFEVQNTSDFTIQFDTRLYYL